MTGRRSSVLALCDRWDALCKGETETTRAVRAAYREDMAAVVQSARDAADRIRNEAQAPARRRRRGFVFPA